MNASVAMPTSPAFRSKFRVISAPVPAAAVGLPEESLVAVVDEATGKVLLVCNTSDAPAIVRALEAHQPLMDVLEPAIRRVEMENAEDNPILSAWLPDARAAFALGS